MTGEVPDLTELYDPDTMLSFGSMTITLAQALAMEGLACTANPAKRQDPASRASWLAVRLADAGQLRPEHTYLLPKPQ